MRTFTFAGSENYEQIELKDVGICTFTIITTFTLEDEDIYSYNTTTTEANSLIHCIKIAQKYVFQLNQESTFN